MHFPEGSDTVRKELQPLLTEHDIEQGVGEGKGHRTAFPPVHSHVRRQWDRACHRKHARVEIQARDCATRADAVCREACHAAGPTGHIQHVLAREQGQPCRKIGGPGAKRAGTTERS